MKKIILNFMLAAALLAGQRAYAQDYFQRISMEGVEMYGLITYSPSGQDGDMTPGMYKFGFDDKFVPDAADVLFARYVAGGGVHHNGKIYCNIYNDEGNLPLQKPVWTILDAETREVLYEQELADNCQATTTSLAYDITNDKIYGIVVDFTNCHLVEIEPETGEMTRVGNDFDRTLRFKTLVSDNDGMLYSAVMNISDGGLYLYKIRKTDGKAVKVAAITAGNLLGPNDYLANNGTEQSMFMDRSTGKAYWIFESSSIALDAEYTALTEINLINAKATLVAYLSGTYQVSGAWFNEPPFGAPRIISDFEFVPTQTGSESGFFRFRLPENNYLGNPLTDAELNVLVTEAGDTLVNAKAAPGTLFESESLNLAYGNHNVTITVANAEGTSPAVQREFYAGFDLPKAPSNIVLVSDGLTTTLTWDAPTEGMNGAAIDPENITYKVVRYPYEVTVAESLTECRLVEEHPADMTRYIYTVTSVYKGLEGGWAYSNGLIVGTPLDPPYGGMFTDVADMFNYYTLIDANGDGHCWTYDSNTRSAVYVYNELQAADDWMIAPPINYKAGETYTLQFKAYSSMAAYLESMEVMFGKDRTPDAMTQLLLDIPSVPAVDEDNPVTEYSVDITVEEDGIYYYGFHANSAKFREYLYVFDIRLELFGSSLPAVDAGSSLSVSAEGGRLRVANPDGGAVAVYNCQGALVDAFRDATYERAFAPGVYIVKTGSTVRKVVVP